MFILVIQKFYLTVFKYKCAFTPQLKNNISVKKVFLIVICFTDQSEQRTSSVQYSEGPKGADA